ncbi:DEAD/DEAH box helicase [Pseudomonas fluorescens]|uniref:DEAD/DEAH box helicase n=2 Tax=Pseudomonas fluorescens TaxID=294 RepID=A0A4Y9TIY3_PSEFL|nr:DEAD/DEAH box helicase [Pseudomonas fluorescens]
MQTKDDIKLFLRNPQEFASTLLPNDAELWMQGLTEVVEPAINAREQDKPLRQAQRDAWLGLSNQRVGLILGPPGTGKTHALSWMATGYLEACRRSDTPCRVLVTAFTRNAISNLMEGLTKRLSKHLPVPVPMYYLGKPAGPLPEGVEQLPAISDSSIDEIWNKLSEPHAILGCTVWQLNRLITKAPKPPSDGHTVALFRLVCMDEASQMLVSQGLMALAALAPGGRVLIAGDDRQLPPIREEHKHHTSGPRLGGSLYSFLRSCNTSEFSLDETFRLNGPLTRYPQRKFYEGKYFSAAPVYERRLNLRSNWREGLQEWEQRVLDPEHPLCVLLHDGPSAATSNEFEAKLTAHLTRLLRTRLEPGDSDDSDQAFWAERLAVVSPHRAQNALIRKLLGDSRGSKVVVETVDRIQGKERDAIIASYTVADSEFALAEADFIFSPLRLNVTITRARSKFILLVSRNLLDAVPSEQDQLDSAQILREFVFEARDAGQIGLPLPNGTPVQVNIRLGSFDESSELPQISTLPNPLVVDLPPMSAWLQSMLATIRSQAMLDNKGVARDYLLAKALARQTKEILSDLITLHRHGVISLIPVQTQHGEYFRIYPLEPARRLYNIAKDTLLAHLEEVIQQTRNGRFPPLYYLVRDRFDCLSPDGSDLLHPICADLAAQGLVCFSQDKYQRLVVDLSGNNPESKERDIPPVPLDEKLSDVDFSVLNRLEDLEARRINFGVFEGWHNIGGLAESLVLSKSVVAGAVRRLELHGHLLHTEDGRLRSRMAELAREVRYVKQRFTPEDSDRRPFLVRGLKVEIRNRDKPKPTHLLSTVVAQLKILVPKEPLFSVAVDALSAALCRDWKVEDPTLRGFQARSLLTLVPAWMQTDEACDRFVITADTGAGKTEAACLPLIIGALYDRLRHIHGTRAILVYPRVRLAANQAQRLTRYLAELAVDPSVPLLTIGLQNGDVPRSFSLKVNEEVWKPGVGAPGCYEFPFFHCPKCDSLLHLNPGAGIKGADRLACIGAKCDWGYSGWIGSKQGLIETPPALFLPTTESLHQWLGDPRYGSLFGDHPEHAPPRALLADEIHLYSHIHGAQIGYALRRLLARAEANGGKCLAIGMSATLGEPTEVWRTLAGGNAVTAIQVDDHERELSIEGREYFYFIQPEVESRGKDIAGASSTIQSLMVLAHGMRRRTGTEGGFRSIVFLDSVDKVKRLHHDYQDAEENNNLARLRTYSFPDSATGGLRQHCCKQPIGCDCFTKGECWFFAANDNRQWTANGLYKPNSPLKVTNSPVWSGAGARAEEMIKDSDIVFATSSLEVGYDDPDMTLVYQHYAPVNLASFIQRKGRGGRGADDRPLTGITLSPYSARDSWYFRKPQTLLDSKHFEVPLNMTNHAVVRGQAITLVLDVIARHEAKKRSSGIDGSGCLHPSVATDADRALKQIFGNSVYSILDTACIDTFWRTVQLAAEHPLQSAENANQRRAWTPWVPKTLFETVNLPVLTVHFEREQKDECVNEDISLALNNIAPGNMTHRYGSRELHWRAPSAGRQPWLDAQEMADANQLDFGGADALLQLLPAEARKEIGKSSSLHPVVFCPRHIKTEVGGKLQGQWVSRWQANKDYTELFQIPAGTQTLDEALKVHHKSSGQLRGFPVIQADASSAHSNDPGVLSGIIERLDIHTGGTLTHVESGLQLARVYWGADSEVRFCDARVDSLQISQLFTHPKTLEAVLFGYRVTTEGVRFHIDSAALSRFVDHEIAAMSPDSEEGKWYRLQMLRYIVQRRARSVDMNSYQAQRAAEIIAAAAGNPTLRKKLLQLTKLWDRRRVRELFLQTYQEVLHQHPLLSERRTEQVAEAAGSQAFQDLLREVFTNLENPEHFKMYLRSLVLHSLAIRLKHAFVLHGRGDERRVVCHAKLPIQFGMAADDIVTIAENGEYGDGTTRTFVGRLDDALKDLAEGFLTECPNAAEDALLARAWQMKENHPQWRLLSPRDATTLDSLRRDLRLAESDEVPFHTLLRVLYGVESIGDYEFAYYDLWSEARHIEDALREQMGRQPSTWELVSAVVGRAREGSGAAPTTHALLHCYASIEDANQEDSLSAEARLADQIYRISGHLCVDGCQACLHTGSDIMPAGIVEAAVSRRLLKKFVDANLRQ